MRQTTLTSTMGLSNQSPLHTSATSSELSYRRMPLYSKRRSVKAISVHRIPINNVATRASSNRKGIIAGTKTKHDSSKTLVDMLMVQEELQWHAIVPFGNVLKSISELLLRCAPHTPMTVDHTGIFFVSCDQTSGRLIHIILLKEDLIDFKLHSDNVPFRCTLETGSLHAGFHQR